MMGFVFGGWGYEANNGTIQQASAELYECYAEYLSYPVRCVDIVI